MKRQLQGHYEVTSTSGEKVRAFVPSLLPPNPPIEWSKSLRDKFDQALICLGRLDAVSSLLPDPLLFLYTYIRKEAVLSSMIEGTQSSLSDLLVYELDLQPGVPVHDVNEVSDYVAAMEYGLERIRNGFPISLRLMCEIHAKLLANGRGSKQAPGEFRRSQNWIGGTRPGNAAFVPPPPEFVGKCMGALELFLHDQPVPTAILEKAALAHVQFETIHPFLDGNGRLGRLLITLLLCNNNVLQQPILYLSLYFKMHRQQYYELLGNVRFSGDWESWLEFFADAVIFTAGQACDTAKRISEMAATDRGRIQIQGRQAGSALRVHQALLERPIANTELLVEKTGLSDVTVNKSLVLLQSLGIAGEITSRRRNRIFCYTRYLQILQEGTELPG